MTIEEFYREKEQADKADKIRRYRILNRYVRKGQIVFAGSSLMEQFPVYGFLMDDQLPLTIYNRGIGGFTSAEMLDALEECVFQLEPAHLFLNIGTNDLNGPAYRQETLLQNYEALLQKILQRLPSVQLYLLAYYPVNPEAASNPYMRQVFRYRTNERIHAASRGVEDLARRYHARFLDLNEGITDALGNLKAEFTVEGMHMYANGYRQVFAALLPILKTIRTN